ncbi:ATP-binding cassette domain-containing protein [Rufibacter tibetensis]|uniref:ABC transporter n=1 Tax=Rufibacter tibetensis TaxID=512763 RepID=A0A0P0C935_9BACT|nr:ATP-binding cassette domain-containing protein [Rufibacter tibetensis]ALJ00063.1 ABC transporter [Rufibacter tibetensis]
MSRPFLSLQNVTIRHQNHVLFHDLNFEVQPGEQWALIGESGSGKSSLLKAIAGEMSVVGGQVRYGFYEEYLEQQPVPDIFFSFRNLLAMVGQKHTFKNLSTNTSTFYYQQRYHATDAEDAPTVEKYLTSVQPAVLADSWWTYARVISSFRLTELLQKQLIKLSNGETKRLLMAAAMLQNPKLLLLDMPLTGLDVESRAGFNQLLTEITSSGVTVILATSAQEIPEAITHVALLKKNRIVSAQPKAAYIPQRTKDQSNCPLKAELLSQLLSETESPEFSIIADLKNVTVTYGDKTVLDQVNWQVRQGERWALLGHNGAGKTTLLSLLNGDNPQAFSKDLTLFDRRRGTSETIWDIKKKIGFVSPELFQFFPHQQTCLQVVESGLYDTLGLFRKSQPGNATKARQWLELLGIAEEAQKPFRRVSASSQRLCLLARALIKHPPLLILDEPCQGMDAQQQERFEQVVDAICANSTTTLMYVTHYPEEIPSCVTKVLKLENGVVVS